MNVIAGRWYLLLLLRDTRGSFTRLRQPRPNPQRVRRPRRPRVRLAAVQLVLF